MSTAPPDPGAAVGCPSHVGDRQQGGCGLPMNVSEWPKIKSPHFLVKIREEQKNTKTGTHSGKAAEFSQ